MTPQQISDKAENKRTPIEQAIYDIHSRISETNTPTANSAYNISICVLNNLLELERKAIEDAYRQAERDCEKVEFGVTPTYRTPQDYFNKTYGTI